MTYGAGLHRDEGGPLEGGEKKKRTYFLAEGEGRALYRAGIQRGRKSGREPHPCKERYSRWKNSGGWIPSGRGERPIPSGGPPLLRVCGGGEAATQKNFAQMKKAADAHPDPSGSPLKGGGGEKRKKKKGPGNRRPSQGEKKKKGLFLP